MTKVNRVVVTGMGCVTPYGIGKVALWNGMQNLKSSLTFDSNLNCVVGKILDVNENNNEININLLQELKRRNNELSRVSKLALIAADEAQIDSGLNLQHGETDLNFKIGVNIGSGIGDLIEIEEAAKKLELNQERRIKPFFIPKILTNIPASYVSQRFKLYGGNLSSATACATGANCIGEAFLNIRSGRWQVAFAGATESCLNKIAIAGFLRMKALAYSSNPNISQPFDQQRCGFVLSEGAAVLVLEQLENALKRKAKIYAEILGYGISNDAFHLTSPNPNGFGSQLCMRNCLEDCNLIIKRSDNVNNTNYYLKEPISYINAHATSTLSGDHAEAMSILNTRALQNIFVSSFKGHIGHTQAAAGAIETLATILTIKNNLIIPTLNLNKPDKNFNLLNFVKDKCLSWKKQHNEKRRIALKNSFGFGGSFVTLAIAEYVQK